MSKPCLGLRLQKRFVRIAEQPPADRFARPVGHVRLADQDHHVQRRKLVAGDLGQLALRHPLVGRAEILANVGRKIIDPPIQQRLGHRRRRMRFAGEQADLVGHANPLEHLFQRMVGQVGQKRFFPAFLHAGESQLHAADVRHDVEASLCPACRTDSGPRRKTADRPRPAPPPACRRLRRAVRPPGPRLAAERHPLGIRRRHFGQRGFGAQQQFGLVDQLPRGGGDPSSPSSPMPMMWIFSAMIASGVRSQRRGITGPTGGRDCKASTGD